MNVIKKYIAWFLLILMSLTISIYPSHQEGVQAIMQKDTAKENHKNFFKKLEMASPHATKTIFLLVRAMSNYLPAFFYYLFVREVSNEKKLQYFTENFYRLTLLRHCLVPKAP